MNNKPKDLEGPPQNEWHWGPPGVGKSYYVRHKYDTAYIKSNNVWWDGYNGEDVVIIEEMGPGQIRAHHINQWADSYCFKADVKNGFIQIRPKKIVITSNFKIEECWEGNQDCIEAVKRRFIVHHHYDMR